MITIYELLGVSEDASKEEIEKAYSQMIFEYRQDIKFDEITNKENQKIINRLKLAYEILTDDEKRKRYDYDLAQKRAENLIKNIPVKEQKENFQTQTNNVIEKVNVNNQQVKNEQIDNHETEKKESNNINAQEVENEETDLLTKEEKSKIRKAAQKEFKQKLKKAKQAEEEYKEAYKKAYNDYLRKMGYKVKEPWTLKRIKRLLITIAIIVLVAIIIWNIPPIRNVLITLYRENFIIKAVVDLVKTIIELF